MDNKGQQGKTKGQPRSSGRFQKKNANEYKQQVVEQLGVDADYIAQVKSELYSGYFDLERLKKAYNLITSCDSANVLTMRRTVLGWSGN